MLKSEENARLRRAGGNDLVQVMCIGGSERGQRPPVGNAWWSSLRTRTPLWGEKDGEREREKDGERERDRKMERGRERGRERWRERKMERGRDGEKDGERERKTEKERD